MTQVPEGLPSNQLLASFSKDVADDVRARLQPVYLRADTTLYEARAPLRHVYFPVTAVVSLVSSLKDGSRDEVAVVGLEGVAGVGAFLGGESALSGALVQRAGWAWRMAAPDIAELARTVPQVMRQLLRYTHVLCTHMAQVSVCHSHHGLGAQLCCWLLQHLDRQADDELRITQERIASLLGMRREGVAAAAGQLQREGLIRYSRGLIQVLDRAGLEGHSCECYAVVAQAYEQMYGSPWAQPRMPSSPRNRHDGNAVDLSRVETA